MASTPQSPGHGEGSRRLPQASGHPAHHQGGRRDRGAGRGAGEHRVQV